MSLLVLLSLFCLCAGDSTLPSVGKLFSECNYKGNSLDIGSELKIARLEPLGGAAKSILILENFAVFVYSKSGFRGGVQRLTESSPCFQSNIGSVRFEELPKHQVQLPKAEDALAVYSMCTVDMGKSIVLDPGVYTASDLSALGLGPSDIAAVFVSKAFSVKLFRQGNFGGGVFVLDHDRMAKLSSQSDMLCLDAVKFGGAVRSLVVTPIDAVRVFQKCNFDGGGILLEAGRHSLQEMSLAQLGSLNIGTGVHAVLHLETASGRRLEVVVNADEVCLQWRLFQRKVVAIEVRKGLPACPPIPQRAPIAEPQVCGRKIRIMPEFPALGTFTLFQRGPSGGEQRLMSSATGHEMGMEACVDDVIVLRLDNMFAVEEWGFGRAFGHIVVPEEPTSEYQVAFGGCHSELDTPIWVNGSFEGKSTQLSLSFRHGVPSADHSFAFPDTPVRSILMDLVLPLHATYHGGEINVGVSKRKLCHHCRNGHVCPRCNGTGSVAIDQGAISFVSSCPQCGGFGSTPTGMCPHCRGFRFVRRQVHVPVKIPFGVRQDQTLRMSHEGDESWGFEHGGVLLKVDLELPDNCSFRDTGELEIVHNITLSEALSGFEHRLDFFDSRPLIIQRTGRITPPGTVLTFPGRGLPSKDDGSAHDALLIRIRVIYPQELKRGQQEALRDVLKRKGKS